MRKRLAIVAAVLVAACLWPAAAGARPKRGGAAPPPKPEPRLAFGLPHVFTDNMVLQRDIALPVWGWSPAGKKVTVTIGQASAEATADANGKWSVKLPAMKAGGPHEMTVTAESGAALTFRNILVGDVWVCSGQSNMEWSVAGSDGAAQEIPAANHPEIRLLHVPKAAPTAAADDVTASWQVCTPQTVPGFSAVAYFFGRELQKELKVPIGLINSSWGGSRIEPWTPAVGYEEVEHFKSGKAPKAGDGGMYNGMIAPLVPYAIRGALWYQGESNMGEVGLYEHRMRALVAGWRKVWGQGDFPFYFVQLAPYAGYAPKLPYLWQEQTKALAIPNTGMAVITDLVSNVHDIHPRNKIDVGHRLALWALAKDYGRKDLVYSGPMYKSMEPSGNKIVLTFDCVGGGLASRDGKDLTHFQIAGADQKFVPAVAKIVGSKIEVSAEGVTAPAAVRFGWDGLANPNLINKEGLPASPFRTDAW